MLNAHKGLRRLSRVSTFIEEAKSRDYNVPIDCRKFLLSLEELDKELEKLKGQFDDILTIVRCNVDIVTDYPSFTIVSQSAMHSNPLQGQIFPYEWPKSRCVKTIR